MKIDISRKDLWTLRSMIHEGLSHEARLPNPRYISSPGMLTVAGKTIRKINRALTKVHGHDCNGASYLKVWQPGGKPEINL